MNNKELDVSGIMPKQGEDNEKETTQEVVAE